MEDTGLATRVARVNSAEIPLSAYSNRNIFKLYYSDIGLLGAKMDIDANLIVAEEDLLGMFKGAFAEQLIFQEMNSTLLNGKIYYYSRDDSRGEIDFIIQGHLGKAIPIEAKSGNE